MNKNKKPNNNNFFNQNPIIIFAIFSIIAIMLFRNFAGDAIAEYSDTQSGSIASTRSITKNISYYDFQKYR